MTDDRALVLSLLAEYESLCEAGGLDPAKFWELGAKAGDVAARRSGPHRAVAYVLRAVLFELAEKLEGDFPITPAQANLLRSTVS